MDEKRTARDIMKAPVITAKEDMLVAYVIKLMADNHITGLPVLDDNGRLLGMITWRMIMNLAVMGEAADTRVIDAWSKHLETYGPICSPDTPIEQILTHFASYRINRIIVVDDSEPNRKVIGIICRSDIISVMDQIFNVMDQIYSQLPK